MGSALEGPWHTTRAGAEALAHEGRRIEGPIALGFAARASSTLGRKL